MSLCVDLQVGHFTALMLSSLRALRHSSKHTLWNMWRHGKGTVGGPSLANGWQQIAQVIAGIGTTTTLSSARSNP